MEESKFDAWTRRRFGIAAGGVLAAAIGGATPDGGVAKKKRKKRCHKVGRSCRPGGRRQCCGNLRCDTNTQEPPSKKTRCCSREGGACTENRDCCGARCCSPAGECASECISDRALKANFGSVDPADMLDRVRALPISTWNYTSDDATIRHIGPMAQDFTSAFGVGADDRHIHPIDGQGVALAAIQGLADLVGELREENAHLAARIAALESRS